MNSRNLLWNLLSGEKTNRIPVAPFIFNNYVNEVLEHPNDKIASCLSLYRKYGFDIILRNYFVADYLDESCIECTSWSVKSKITGDIEKDWNEQTVITTPERRLTQIKSYRKITPNETVEAITEYFIKDKSDLDQFIKYQPPIGKYDYSIITYAKEQVGNDGITGPWVQGAFNYAGTYRELSELLMDPYIDENFYKELMEYFTSRLISYVQEVIKAGADFISLSGNKAIGSMTGPKMFAEYIMPYECRIIEAIHKAGAKVIYHNCGDARSLLPLYNEMNIDMYESLTSPPYGDTIFEEALNIIKLPTVLSGGIDQIDFLKKSNPEQIEEKVKEVMTLSKKRGGFILAASDYISEGTPEGNIFALSQAGHRYGAI